MKEADRQARERVAAVFDLAPFISLVGCRLVDAGVGWAETALDLDRRLLQQHGFAHAGVVTTLADHTSGGAASTMVPEGSSVLTAEIGIRLLRPARGDMLACRAEIVKAGRTLIVTEADVHSDGRHVARLNATMAVVDQAIG